MCERSRTHSHELHTSIVAPTCIFTFIQQYILDKLVRFIYDVSCANLCVQTVSVTRKRSIKFFPYFFYVFAIYLFILCTYDGETIRSDGAISNFRHFLFITEEDAAGSRKEGITHASTASLV